MLDFKKVLLALSVAALGFVGTASAQTLVCNGSTGGATATALAPAQGFPGAVAVEGTTELLPQFVIACNGGNASGSYNILLTTNAPITNTLVSAAKGLDISAVDNLGNTAVVTLVAPSTIQASFSSIVAGGLTTITVKGIRVNASGNPLLSTITITPSSTSTPEIGTVGTFAYVEASLINSFAYATPAVPPAGPTLLTVNVSACNVDTVANPAATIYNAAYLVLNGGFPDAMHSAAENLGPVSVAPLTAQGTTYAVTFSNLDPAGVAYYVPAVIAGTGVTVTAVTSASATTNATAAANGVALTVSSTGTATVYYQVTADAGGAQTFTIPVTYTVAKVASVTSFTTSPISASILLVSSGNTYPQYSATETAYSVAQTTQTAVGTGNGLLSPCATTLLFPYVTNLGGFDTGIAITNASTGASTTLSPITAASGTCSVMFYGTGVPTTNPYVTAVVGTGAAAVQVFDVGTVAPGFSGYVVATCNFQGGHGYAFLSDGLGSGTGVAANYIAVVLGDANLANAAVAGVTAQ
jgi:hypothetical protein